MLKKLLSGFISLLLTSFTYAATNPIEWSVDSHFPNTTRQGVSYTVTYTFTNNLPFTLVHPIVIGKSANPASDFSYSDSCTGQNLTPNQTCTVSVTLTPASTGEKSVTLTIEGYDKNQVPLPTLASTTTTNAPVSISFSTTTQLPTPMNVGDPAQPWKYTITNNGHAVATGIIITSNQLAFNTTCTSGTPATGQLAPGASCTVSGTFTPTSATPSVQVITATFAYTESITPVTGNSIFTNVTNLTGITVSAPEFQSIVLYGSSYDMTFTFTNHDAVDATVTNANPSNPDFAFSPSSTCPLGVGILHHGDSCTYTGTLTPTSPTTSYNVTSELTYPSPPAGSPTTATRSTTAQAAGAGSRTFTFTNQCNFNVWFSFVGGAITNSPACTSSAQCPSGTTCNISAQLCFWNNYGPASPNTFKLLPGVGPVSVIIPEAPTNLLAPGVLWSGVVSASLNCNGSSNCLQADCSRAGGSASCAPGIGFGQPATQAEFTLLTNAQDSYDVEVINGFHIPIKMAPNGGRTIANYFCGTPGNETISNGFGACNWDTAVPPTPKSSYYWVTSGGLTCPSHTCPAGQVCGLDIGINQVCGDFLGYWSANNACAVNATKAQPLFGCSNYLTSPPYPATTFEYSQLYGCKTPDASQPLLNSCYSTGVPATDQCCGCANWQNIPGVTLPASTNVCPNTGNIDWIPLVQNTLQWIKLACPNYYTYPYDDASASFGCDSTTAAGLNLTNYDITFCAGGDGTSSAYTGLPAGVTDGRG